MEWILLEIAVALGMAGFIIWYTVGSKPKRGAGGDATEKPRRSDRQEDQNL
jgi:hypothetical protein